MPSYDVDPSHAPKQHELNLLPSRSSDVPLAKRRVEKAQKRQQIAHPHDNHKHISTKSPQFDLDEEFVSAHKKEVKIEKSTYDIEYIIMLVGIIAVWASLFI